MSRFGFEKEIRIMDELWGAALSKMTSKIIVGVILITLSLIAYVLIVKYGHLVYKKKAYKTPGVSKRGLTFILDFVSLNLLVIFSAVIFLLFLPDSKALLNDYFAKAVKDSWRLFKYDFWYAEHVLLATYCFYSMVAELSSWNGTFAMNRSEMKVVDMGGGKPKPVQLFTRNLVKFGVILYWPVFFLLTYTNSHRRWVHEIVSRTKVVEV